MEAIRNTAGKTVCRADAKERVVEIKLKGIVTTIRFLCNGTIEVKNMTA